MSPNKAVVSWRFRCAQLLMSQTCMPTQWESGRGIEETGPSLKGLLNPCLTEFVKCELMGWRGSYSLLNKLKGYYKFRSCQKCHRVNLPLNNPMPCLASFFDGMSVFNNLLNILPVITCDTSACNPSTICWNFIILSVLLSHLVLMLKIFLKVRKFWCQ